MGKTTLSAVIGGATKTTAVGQDNNKSYFALLALLDLAGNPFGTADNPLVVQMVGNGSATVPVTTANSGTSQALAFPSSGNAAFDITLTANCTFSLSGGAAGQLQTITLVIRGGSGGFSATLPTGIKWPGGVVPTVDGSAGSYNEFYIRTLDGGATYSGNY